MNRQKLNRLNKLAEKIGNGNQEETNQAFEEMMGIYKNEFRLIISFWAQRKNYSLDRDDLIQIASLTLFQTAIKWNNSNRGRDFACYVNPAIRAALIRQHPRMPQSAFLMAHSRINAPKGRREKDKIRFLWTARNVSKRTMIPGLKGQPVRQWKSSLRGNRKIPCMQPSRDFQKWIARSSCGTMALITKGRATTRLLKTLE